MICPKLIGRLNSNSYVPSDFSPAILRMPMAGTKNSNKYGARLKKLSNDAYPASNKEVSGKTHSSRPVIKRKIPIAR